MKRLLHGSNSEELHPIKYQWAWKHYTNAVANRWHWNEVGFTDDVAHYGSPDRTPEEKRVIELTLGWLANMDNLVLENLLEKVSTRVTAIEARMFLAEQIASEAVHTAAYWNCNESMSLDHDRINRMWREHTSMVEKADWAREKLRGVEGDDRDFLKSIIAFGVCIEGLEFMSSFVMLLAMRNQGNLFPGIAKTINWIQRDETQHAYFHIDLAREIKAENPKLWDAKIARECQVMVMEAAEMETHFMRDTMGDEGVFGLLPRDMAQYIRHMAEKRMGQIGVEPLGRPTKFPESMRWLDEYNGSSHTETNFFEGKVMEYAVGGLDFGKDALPKEIGWDAMDGQGEVNGAVCSIDDPDCEACQ